MPYTVQDLIEDQGEIFFVKLDDPIHKALELMIDHDFSQLPVVDEQSRPLGMVTHESISKAMLNFGVSADALMVSDTVTKVSPFFHLEDDLFDLLDRLKDTNAVLIVDREGKLVGIVTSFDTTEYFRRRAQDMMYVEDIESMIKDFIQGAYSDEAGEVNKVKLAAAIREITSSNKDLRARFAKSLHRYLSLQGSEKPNINPKWLEESLSLLIPKEKVKDFADLSFNEYMELILKKECWELYQSVFNIKLEAEAFRKLLINVRDIRNTLAHFRGVISPIQRKQLKFCIDWLSQYQRPIQLYWLSLKTTKEPLSSTTIREAPDLYVSIPQLAQPPITSSIIPIEEQIGPEESRYAPLAIFLRSQPRDIDRLQLTFQKVEEIINTELPESARQHRSWWANDSSSRSQSLQWLDIGWRVSYLNLEQETVTFNRVKEREKEYIHFFSQLLAELRKEKDFPLKRVSPDGQSWITVAWLPEKGPQQAALAFSFARHRLFRVELYIDLGDCDKNKQVFDEIFSQKATIERTLDIELNWERLNDRRASRIACMHPGAITDKPGDLRELRNWAAEIMPRFYTTLLHPTTKALKRVSDQ